MKIFYSPSYSTRQTRFCLKGAVYCCDFERFTVLQQTLYLGIEFAEIRVYISDFVCAVYYACPGHISGQSWLS